MASYTDNVQALSASNPYIQQQPVQQMIQAEQIMQSREDEGIQKLQQIDQSLAQLPLIKDSAKQYLSDQLQGFKSSLTGLTAGSLADQRTISQIGAMSNAIANDPVIQSNVNSTLAIQNGNQQLADDRKKGIYNPANAGMFQKSVNEYLSNPDVKSSFNGSYITPFDYNKLVLDNINNLHPTKTVTQNDLRIGPDGKTVLANGVIQELTTDGITPQQIQSAVNLALSDPRAQQQLQIESQYHYGDLTPTQIGQKLADTYNNTIQSNNQIAHKLQIQAASSTQVNATQIAQQLKQLTDINSSKLNEYNQMTGLLKSNPDALKQQLYRSQIESNYVNTYAYQNTSDIKKADPLFQAQIQEENLKFKAQDFALRQQEFAYKQQRDAQLDIAKANKNLNPDGTPKGTAADISVPAPVDASQQPNQQTFQDKVNQSVIDYNQVVSRNIDAFAKATGTPSPYRYSNGQWVLNVGGNGYKTADDAKVASQGLQSEIQYHNYNATAAPIAEEAAKEMNDSYRVYSNYNIRNQQIQQQLGSFLQNVKADPTIKDILLDNKSTPVSLTSGATSFMGGITTKKGNISNQDLLNLAIYNSTNDPKIKQQIADNYSEKSLDLKDIQEAASGPTNNFGNTYRTLYHAAQQNPDLQRYATFANDQYSSSQQVNQEYINTLSIAKSTDRNTYKSAFSGLLASPSALESYVGSNGGQVGKMLDLMHADNGSTGALSYSYIPHDNGDMTLRVQKGSDAPVEVTIPSATAQASPFFKGDSRFYQMFGASLALTNNTTTDVSDYLKPAQSANDGGLASAYQMNTQGGNYKIKYQLHGNGQGGYFLNTWIYDKQGNPLIVNKPFYVPSMGSRFTTRGGIMNTLDTVLSNDRLVQAYIQSQNPNQSSANGQQ